MARWQESVSNCERRKWMTGGGRVDKPLSLSLTHSRPFSWQEKKGDERILSCCFLAGRRISSSSRTLWHHHCYHHQPTHSCVCVWGRIIKMGLKRNVGIWARETGKGKRRRRRNNNNNNNATTTAELRDACVLSVAQRWPFAHTILNSNSSSALRVRCARALRKAYYKTGLRRCLAPFVQLTHTHTLPYKDG